MSELGVRVVFLLVWAAIVSLDERTWGSFAFHQPLVAASVAGALMGNLMAGMLAGLVLQSFWPALLPIGGALLPSAGVASVLAGATAAWGGHLIGSEALWTTGSPLFFAIVLGLAAAGAGQALDRSMRARNEFREERALSGDGPLEPALTRALRAAWADAALRGIVLVAAGGIIAAIVYLWPAALRALGSPLPAQVGWALPLAALGLGLGSLAFFLQGARPRLSRELGWGLAAGAALQLLRGL